MSYGVKRWVMTPKKKIGTPGGKPGRKNTKYKAGDCISIDCNGVFLAVWITNIYNRYYDLTLINYCSDVRPTMNDFLTGQFFGTRFGSWEELMYAVNVRMIECKYIDAEVRIEKIGSVNLKTEIRKDGYEYLNSVEELMARYNEELPVRIVKTANAEKFPDLAFVSKHLIAMEDVVY